MVAASFCKARKKAAGAKDTADSGTDVEEDSEFFCFQRKRPSGGDSL